MASPVVAGIMALWLQVNPKLTPAAVKELMQQTAIRKAVMGTLPNKMTSSVFELSYG